MANSYALKFLLKYYQYTTPKADVKVCFIHKMSINNSAYNMQVLTKHICAMEENQYIYSLISHVSTGNTNPSSNPYHTKTTYKGGMAIL